MGEDEGNRLASLDRELPDGFEVFAAKRNRGPQDHPLWAGKRSDRAVIQSVDPRHRGAVVEADRELGAKIHSA